MKGEPGNDGMNSNIISLHSKLINSFFNYFMGLQDHQEILDIPVCPAYPVYLAFPAVKAILGLLSWVLLVLMVFLEEMVTMVSQAREETLVSMVRALLFSKAIESIPFYIEAEY